MKTKTKKLYIVCDFSGDFFFTYEPEYSSRKDILYRPESCFGLTMHKERSIIGPIAKGLRKNTKRLVKEFPS